MFFKITYLLLSKVDVIFTEKTNLYKSVWCEAINFQFGKYQEKTFISCIPYRGWESKMLQTYSLKVKVQFIFYVILISVTADINQNHPSTSHPLPSLAIQITSVEICYFKWKLFRFEFASQFISTCAKRRVEVDCILKFTGLCCRMLFITI